MNSQPRGSHPRLLTALALICLLAGPSAHADTGPTTHNPFDPSLPENAVIPSLQTVQSTCGASTTTTSSCGSAKCGTAMPPAKPPSTTSPPPKKAPPPALTGGNKTSTPPPKTEPPKQPTDVKCGGGTKVSTPSANDIRTGAQTRARRGMGYADVDEEETTPTGPQGPAIADTIDELGILLCKEGAKRRKGAPFKVEWGRMAAPRPFEVLTSSDIDHGRYQTEGLKETIDLTNTISNAVTGAWIDPALGPLLSLPDHGSGAAAGATAGGAGITGAGAGAAGGATSTLSMGVSIAKAGADLAERIQNDRNFKIADRQVKQDMMQPTLECVPYLICNDRGKWVETGPMVIEDTLQLNDGKSSYYPRKGPVSVQQNEFKRFLHTALSGWKKEYDRLQTFIMDPCQNNATPDKGSTPPAEEPAKRNCQDILVEINQQKAELDDVSNNIKRERANLETLKRKKGATEYRYRDDLAAIKQKIAAAQQALEEARGRMNRSQDRLQQAASSPDLSREDAQRLSDMAAKYSDQFDAAQARLDGLQGEMEGLNQKYNEEIASLNKQIGRTEDRIADDTERQAALRKQIEKLEWDYEDCLAGR